MTGISSEQAGALVEAAREAARHAHAPYTRFAVGAALLLSDGGIVSGANFENASYGLSLCAETVALASANTQGQLADVVAIAVIGGPAGPDGLPTGSEAVFPCGRCRQVMNEAAQMGGRDLPVFCASADGRRIERHRLSALRPHAFGPKDLGLA